MVYGSRELTGKGSEEQKMEKDLPQPLTQFFAYSTSSCTNCALRESSSDTVKSDSIDTRDTMATPGVRGDAADSNHLLYTHNKGELKLIPSSLNRQPDISTMDALRMVAPQIFDEDPVNALRIPVGRNELATNDKGVNIHLRRRRDTREVCSSNHLSRYQKLLREKRAHNFDDILVCRQQSSQLHDSTIPLHVNCHKHYELRGQKITSNQSSTDFCESSLPRKLCSNEAGEAAEGVIKRVLKRDHHHSTPLDSQINNSTLIQGKNPLRYVCTKPMKFKSYNLKRAKLILSQTHPKKMARASVKNDKPHPAVEPAPPGRERRRPQHSLHSQ